MGYGLLVLVLVFILLEELVKFLSLVVYQERSIVWLFAPVVTLGKVLRLGLLPFFERVVCGPAARLATYEAFLVTSVVAVALRR